MALATTRGVADLLETMGPTDDPYGAIEWANVLLMCSKQETFVRVTVEALMSGRPVVGSRTAGACEGVSDGEDGLLFTPGDAAGLAACIRQLDQDRQLSRRMGVRARVRNAYKDTVREYVEVVTDVVHRSRHESLGGKADRVRVRAGSPEPHDAKTVPRLHKPDEPHDS